MDPKRRLIPLEGFRRKGGLPLRRHRLFEEFFERRDHWLLLLRLPGRLQRSQFKLTQCDRIPDRLRDRFGFILVFVFLRGSLTVVPYEQEPITVFLPDAYSQVFLLSTISLASRTVLSGLKTADQESPSN